MWTSQLQREFRSAPRPGQGGLHPTRGDPAGVGSGRAARPGLARLGTPAGASRPLCGSAFLCQATPAMPLLGSCHPMGFPSWLKQEKVGNGVFSSRFSTVLVWAQCLPQIRWPLSLLPLGTKTSRPVGLSFLFKGNGGIHSVFTTE